MKTNNSFLYEKATAHLARIITDGNFDPSVRLPTDLELSAALGISRITCRRAFTALEEIGAVTRIKGKGTFVSPAADKDKVYALLAASTAKRRLGAIFPSSRSNHVQRIIGGILQAADDFEISVASSEMNQTRESSLIREFIERKVDGLIIYPVDNEFYNDLLLDLNLNKFPVILVDRYLNGLHFPCVSSDHRDIIRKSVDYLAAKHSNILFFNGNIESNSPLRLRADSFSRSIAGYPSVNGFTYTFSGEPDVKPKLIAEFIDYLKSRREITAMITADHATSMLVKDMRPAFAAEKINVKTVYLDMFRSDFDNYDSHPAFVEQDSYRIGAEVVRLMKRLLSGAALKDNVLIPVKLYPET